MEKRGKYIRTEKIKKTASKTKKEFYKNHPEQHPMYRKHHSAKTRKKQSNAKLGKKQSAKTKLKISNSNKGKHFCVFTEEHKQKIRESKLGKNNFPITNKKKKLINEFLKNNTSDTWKYIKNYKGIYKINTKGEIYSFYTQKYLKSKKHPKGYLYIGLCKKGKRNTFKIHRLVAQTFILNPENKPQINHIDGNKSNNCVKNLEWCTNGENQKHAFLNGLQTPNFLGKFGKNNPSSIPIIQLTLNDVFIKEWENGRQIERELGYKHGYIAGVCTGKYKSAYGFKWKHNLIKI